VTELPVALFIFNRPGTTRLVVEAIRRAAPPLLLIVADGPRPEREGEADLVAECRELALAVDWPCEVRTDFSDRNLGCRERLRTGLDWVFSQVDRAVVLEDDCVPHSDFFDFCQTALDLYAGDERVGAVTGDNFLGDRVVLDTAWFFSKYLHVWGWATWADRWDAFRRATGDDAGWLSGGSWEVAHPSRVERMYWRRRLRGVMDGSNDTWDYDWVAYCWSRSWLTVTPSANLVENVGIGADATHTTGEVEVPRATSLPARPAPELVVEDVEADRFTFDHHYGGAEFRRRLRPMGFARWALRRR
jgi:hypothetical protein